MILPKGRQETVECRSVCGSRDNLIGVVDDRFPLRGDHDAVGFDVSYALSKVRKHLLLCDEVGDLVGRVLRSEEHTSELQSLMRISYAVFCLKKKKRHNKSEPHIQSLDH